MNQTEDASATTTPLNEQTPGVDSRLAQRYRRLLLAVTLPLFFVVLALAITQYADQRRQVLDALKSDSENYALTVESMAKLASDHVTQMQSWTEAYLSAPPITSTNTLSAYFTQRKNAVGLPDGYTLDTIPSSMQNRAGQIFWIDTMSPGRSESRAQLDMALDFFSVVRLTHEVSPYFHWSFFLPADRHFIAIYPWAKSQTLVEDQGLPNLLQGMPHFFEYEHYTKGTPEKNPTRSFYWTQPHADASGSGTLILHGAPVYLDGRFQGVVGTDLRLATLEKLLQTLPRRVGRLWVVDDQQYVLADSAGSPSNTALTLSQVLPAELDAAAIAAAPMDEAHDTGKSVALRQQIQHAPWTLLYIIDNSEIDALLLPRMVPYVVILAMLGGTFLLALYLLRREFINPALELVNYIQRASRNPTEPEPALPRLWQAWAHAVARAFSDNVESSRKLRDHENFMSAAVENALMAVITMDEYGRIVEFNRAAERMFGRAKQDVLYQDLAHLILPERFHGAHYHSLAKYRASETPLPPRQPKVIAGLRADGTEFPVELSISAARLGEKRFATAFVVDLSDRVRAEEQMARQREALRQSEKLSAMGAMLAGVAHELNNPLAILMGRAALLEDKATDPAVREDAARIKAAADRCGRIVRTFLSMARKKPAQRHTAQLNTAVQGALDLLGYNLRTAGIDVHVQLDPELPEIEMDADQIGQVVVNFLVNAQQVLAEQPGARQIVISTAHEDNCLIVRVADNGPGVPDELRERIFDPFFTTKPEGTGTGIGLSVSRAIAREHGGELILENTAVGASFLLRLPLGAQMPATAARANAATEPRPGHALIVDDEAEVAEVLSDILASAGYRTAITGGGEEALAWLEKNDCDLMFCDVRMPGMDGPALWRELQARFPEITRRLAFVTGDTFSASIEPFLRETGQPWLEKPFTPESVLELAVQLEAD
ncbi:MAG: PAS domain S-box protein [Spongiibacteraceae bacterium]